MFASHLQYATRPPRPIDGEVTIRLARRPERAIEQLAELDGRVLPAGPRLVAEIDGRPIAALALADATAVADPMRRSAPFVELLRVRARQLAGA
jgi:hypothetical protein